MVTVRAPELVSGTPGHRICRAIYTSDNRPCQWTATSVDQNFCGYHAKQCFDMYKGYKRRNAQLDNLIDSPPEYLAESKIKLANDDFATVEELNILEEIQEYLLDVYNLSDAVIQARKLHHSHFYAKNMDYGHEKLTYQKALERVTLRTAEVLYQKKRWFKWARECQAAEEKQRENEQKKIKREAALFRRQAKEVEARLREFRAKEDARRQEQYLEQAYQENLANQPNAFDDEDLDPIQDFSENQRGTYIALIRHFLWLELQQSTDSAPAGNATIMASQDSAHEPLADVNGTTDVQELASETSTLQVATKKKKAKSRKNKGGSSVLAPEDAEAGPATDTGPANRSGPVLVRSKDSTERPENEPDMTRIEGRDELVSRLLEGMEITNGKLMYHDASGKLRQQERMEPMTKPEVDRIVEEVAEIKTFLFCRLLLSNAVLLPAAMKADSVEFLLQDPEIKSQDLRDLCLRLEQPQLQEIRDACADFYRKDDENDQFSEDESSEDDEPNDDALTFRLKKRRHKHHLPEVWQSKREKGIQTTAPQAPPGLQHHLEQQAKAENQGTTIDFGNLDDKGEFQKANIRVKICGRYIYNYPSQGSMKRGGWLHFSIIAKDCSLHKAVELCKSWDEFSELSVLTLWHYFPNPEWLVWAGDLVRQQYTQVGFFPYMTLNTASDVTTSQRGRDRTGRRVHASSESRNYVCAHMKRNDPVSRRFIQYMSMETSRVLILVRDGKTGRIIWSPPEDELWLARVKRGYGRAARTEWETVRYVGPTFFEEMEKQRRFRLGLDDHYDIYIWCTDPGTPPQFLHASVMEILYRAHRVVDGEGLFSLIAPILKTLTRDGDAWRTQDLQEGENAPTVWDEMMDDPRFEWRTPDGDVSKEIPKNLVYTEADALEEEILFPGDMEGKKRFKPIKNRLTEFESGRMIDSVMRHFVTARDISDKDSEESDTRYIEAGSDEENDWEDEDSEGEESPAFPESRRLAPEDSKEENTDVTKFDPETAVRGIMSKMFPELNKGKAIIESFGPGPQEEDLDMEDELMKYVDMYKAKAFKKSWHDCFLEPGTEDHWRQYSTIYQDAEDSLPFFQASFLLAAQVLRHLNYHPHQHPRVTKDAQRASTVIMLFGSNAASFFKSKRAAKHKNSKLFDQSERSKHIPDRWSCTSCKYRDKKFYQPLDDAIKKSRSSVVSTHYDEVPMEWDICIRPKIAQLFKHGIICVSYAPEEYICGRAFATKEGDRPLDLFLDYRPCLYDIRIPKHLISPYGITVDSLREDARQFAASTPKARFALLRLWSSPYFYPFMVGYEQRQNHAFVDAIGRTWEWKFMPTDSPYSEHSVHYNMTLRFRDHMARFDNGKKLKIRKDVVLVLAKDEEELMRLASAATFLVQTRPWRTEIDFWKSFVNVDVDFLCNLNDAWWL
ncbi:hypothetical protein H2200_000427 [Cladophialophora chaetospira]|uniref:Uncharacterized protein n=1 Tax=Cladophialophora chaetospira TaxID=386627 RepID=A0AA38XND8_9EURO|nr:hypothetical protein H2200_000427 [Cladophialophora chaetospira]